MKYVGIVGGGGISETHARAVGELGDARVSALFGRNEAKVARLAERYSAKPYTTFESFLAHKPMDLVIIGSPSGLHADQGIAAANHGLHVLVEKPIDVTSKCAEALIAACEKAGVQLGVCYQDRFSPDIFKLKLLIDSNELGKLIVASGRVQWYRPPEYYSDSDWRASPSLAGGGALMSQAIHTVDSLLWLVGDVARVYAHQTTAFHEVKLEDTLVATLQFTNGAIGTLEAATSIYPGYDRQIAISGSEGTVVIERDRMIRCDLRAGRMAELGTQESNANLSASSPVISDVSGHKRIIEDFMNAIDGKGPARCDGREGLRSVKVVEALYESARQGMPVNLD